VREGLEIVFVLEGEFDGGDFVFGAVGKVGDGAVLNLAVFAKGFTKQDAGVNLAFDGDFAGVEIH